MKMPAAASDETHLPNDEQFLGGAVASDSLKKGARDFGDDRGSQSLSENAPGRVLQAGVACETRVTASFETDSQSDQPPSTLIDAPVTKPPRSEHIQITAAAISSGFPSRPIGS